MSNLANAAAGVQLSSEAVASAFSMGMTEPAPASTAVTNEPPANNPPVNDAPAPDPGVSPAISERGPPAELMARSQWVAYRLKPDPKKPEKPKKIPYRDSHTKADTTDPTTWLPYADAVALARNGAGFTGIGYVFAKDDPYTGIDLDGVRDPVTGSMTDETWAAIQQCGSYTEVSPSGTGVHIITRAVLADGCLKTAAFEAYDRNRYFTFTGQVVGGYDMIREAQAAVTALVARHRPVKATASHVPPPARNADLDDTAVEALILASDKAAAYHRLAIAGETRPGRSASEDDFELACILVKQVGGDLERLERLMRGSALATNRPKWDRTDYLPRTIRAALGRSLPDDRPTTTEPARNPTLLTFAELIALPRLPWLVEGLLPAEGVTAIGGHWGTYKSFIVLDILAAVAGGIPDWFSFPLRKHGPAVYIYAEGRAGLGQRARAVRAVRQLDEALPLRVRPTALDMTSGTAVEQLIADIRTATGGADPAVIAIDTLARNMPGNENQQQDMNAFIAGCDRLRTAFSCQVIAVHHNNKADELRGSTVLPGAVDTLLTVTSDTPLMAQLTVAKQKDGADTQTWTVQLRPEGDSLVIGGVTAGATGGATPKTGRPRSEWTGGELDALQAICEAGKPLRAKDWEAAAETGFETSTGIVNNARRKAATAGLISHTVDGRWQVTPAGWSFARAQHGWSVTTYEYEPATAVEEIT